VSRGDRILSGADFFAATIDGYVRQQGGAGFVCQAVLELEGHLAPEVLEMSVARLAESFPALGDRVVRPLPLALPRWRRDRAGRVDVGLDHVCVDAPWTGEGPAQAALVEQLSTPLPIGGGPLLHYRLVHLPQDRCLVALAFNHVLSDATGIERLLGWQQALQPAPPVLPEPDPPVGGGLAGLRERAESARRFLPWFDTFEAHPPKELQPVGPLGELRTWRLTLDAEQSRAVDAAMRAAKAAMNPTGWLLGTCLQEIHALAMARGEAPEAYLVPVAMGTRRKGDHRPDLANRLGFLFVHLRAEELTSLPEIARAIRRLSMEQLGDDLPRTLVDALTFARRLPAARVGRFLQTSVHGSFASFYFGYTGAVTPALETFLGHRVTNLLHYPTLPAPPGLVCVFNRFGHRLNACLVLREGILSTEEETTLKARLTERLLRPA